MNITSDALANAEDRRRELVTALNLPPETTWADALARVVPVESVGAKGCHGCKFSYGLTCFALLEGSGVQTWQSLHLSPADLMTPKPGAPECPGRQPKEQG